jgi:nitrite reductase/ring-hydroxylating ferredoxin subunit
MACGGWLGGTLVFRNQIGVDHRYANAGKWKEEEANGPAGEPLDVAGADELKVGQMKLLHVNGRRIVLARTESGHVAFDDHCTHRGGSLADGTLACGTVTCPWHGSQFDVRTGEVVAGPAKDAIRSYPAEATNGEVRITL